MVPLSLFLVSLFLSPSLQSIDNNIEDPIDEVKFDILKEQTLQNVGGLLTNFMQSKEFGNMLSNGENGGDILQGLGSVLGQGFDPSVVGMFANMMMQQQNGKKSEGLDLNVLGSLFGALTSNSGGGEGGDFWSYLPMFLQTANSFLGPEAQQRAKDHEGHAFLLPPVVEKMHLWFDHFTNSDMGKKIFSTFGAEKFVKVFADESGKISYKKFVDMLENHSFRKHWIRMVTNKIASMLTMFSDSPTQKKYLTTFQHFINSILRSQQFPKSALFDQSRPSESMTSLIDYFVKKNFGMEVDSKPYVKPVVQYLQELFQLAEKRGMLGLDSQQLSNKLADTINLDFIEPIARVNRAYRFARKVKQCDKYVMCLVNEESEDRKTNLSGFRPILSKSSALILSWFLSSDTGSPYFDLYKAVMDNTDCQVFYSEACHDFHLEEIKVKKEYIHSEL